MWSCGPLWCLVGTSLNSPHLQPRDSLHPLHSAASFGSRTSHFPIFIWEWVHPLDIQTSYFHHFWRRWHYLRQSDRDFFCNGFVVVRGRKNFNNFSFLCYGGRRQPNVFRLSPNTMSTGNGSVCFHNGKGDPY